MPSLYNPGVWGVHESGLRLHYTGPELLYLGNKGIVNYCQLIPDDYLVVDWHDASVRVLCLAPMPPMVQELQ